MISKRSKTSSAKKTRRPRSGSGLGIPEDVPVRTLTAATRRKARPIADRYTLFVGQNQDQSGRGLFLARCLELPGAFANGRTRDEAIEKLKHVLEIAVGSMLERGAPLPAIGEVKRSEQINVRLTRTEALRFEHAAKRAGFRSISDFLRSAALREAS